MKVVSIVVVSLWLTAIVGWVSNIVQIVGMIHDPITALIVVKAVGVFFAPLGSILGLIGLF